MSPLRFFRELTVMGCATAGAVLGYLSGCGFGAHGQVCLAFLGMGLGGAFADFCLTRSR